MKYPIQVLFREYFEGILAAVFLALFLRFFVVSVLYVPTDNLEPVLVRGDFVIGWRLSYGFPLPLMQGERMNLKPPQRGDLISFRFPGDNEQVIIRRVIAVAGDQLSITNGIITINGEELPQNSTIEGRAQEVAHGSGQTYEIVTNPTLNVDAMKLPKGTLFVLSDNRTRSDDSREWGYVPLKNVESRVVLIWLSVKNNEEGIALDWPRMLRWIQ